MQEDIRKYIAIICITLMTVLGFKNIDLVIDPAKRAINNEISFIEFKEEASEAILSDDFRGKDFFINVNGLFARMTARRSFNETTLLRNGMLTFGNLNNDNTDIQRHSEGLAEFSAFLTQRNIPYLYIQAPYKVDVEGKLLPYGLDNLNNNNADIILRELASYGVTTLDLRKQLSSTIDQIEESFYRTDHHWNADGAFRGFQLIMEKIQSITKEENLDVSLIDKNMWSRKTIEDWFLGSHGKRVGKYYAGVDNLTYYIPKFETQMSCIIPKHKQLFIGDFKEANIRQKYIDKCDYFGYNAYCVYVGGDYPLVHHKNLNAPNKKKLLILKDSFTLPIQCFMATEFTEVDVIDPRHYSESSIVDYCTWTNPDIVLSLTSTTQIGKASNYELGLDTFAPRKKRTILDSYSTSVKASNKTRSKKIPVTLKKGRAYCVSIDNVERISGNGEGARMLLYERKEGKPISSTIIDISYCNENGGAEWSFRVPEDGLSDAQYELLVYSGLQDNKPGELLYSGISIAEYEEE